MRSDNETNMDGRGKNRYFGRKYSNGKLHLEDIFSNIKTHTQYTAEK
jgi:hypothetical protein